MLQRVELLPPEFTRPEIAKEEIEGMEEKKSKTNCR